MYISLSAANNSSALNLPRPCIIQCAHTQTQSACAFEWRAHTPQCTCIHTHSDIWYLCSQKLVSDTSWQIPLYVFVSVKWNKCNGSNKSNQHSGVLKIFQTLLRENWKLWGICTQAAAYGHEHRTVLNCALDLKAIVVVPQKVPAPGIHNFLKAKDRLG